MTTIEELEAALKYNKSVLVGALYCAKTLSNYEGIEEIKASIKIYETIDQTLTQAIAIKKGECVVSREMRLTIEGMAKQPLTTEMDEVLKWSADYTDGYDEMIKRARKLEAMIAAQEEK